VLDDLSNKFLSRSPWGGVLKRALTLHEQQNARVGGELDHGSWVVDASEFSVSRLREMSHNFQRPVVVRGLFADVPAVKRWSPEFFAEQAGDTVVQVVDQQSDTVHDMRLRDFLEGHDGLYLKFWPELFRAHPQFVDDLAFDRVFPEWIGGPGSRFNPFTAEFFMGRGVDAERGIAGTPLHCAPHANLFVEIYGRKTWTLIDPKHTLLLRPVLQETYGVSALTPSQLAERELPRYSVTLEPGDALFNPPWFWHQVQNDGFCIGIASRDVMVRANFRQNAVFSTLRPWFTVLAGLNRFTGWFSAKKPPEKYAEQDRHAHGHDSVVNRRMRALRPD